MVSMLPDPAAPLTATVLGASGGIGSAVVRELSTRGYRVRAVSRRGNVPGVIDGSTGPAVTPIAADIANAEQLHEAVAGSQIVFHCAAPAYHRWVAELPAMTDAVITSATDAGSRLVVADNLYMYGPHIHGSGDRPLREDLPYTATGRKGRVRAAVAERLLAAHASGRLPVTLGRLSDYYGPGGLNTNAGARVFDRARAGKKVRLIGRLDVPHTWAYLPDVARCLVTLAESAPAYGQAWHLPAAPALTGREFLDLVFASAAQPIRTGTVSSAVLRVGGVFNATIRELPENLYQFERPYVVDDSAYLDAFGPFECTPHAAAIAATSQWFRQRRQSPKD
jgi:nucleoside-diphosphate-sugar epimerase